MAKGRCAPSRCSLLESLEPSVGCACRYSGVPLLAGSSGMLTRHVLGRPQPL